MRGGSEERELCRDLWGGADRNGSGYLAGGLAKMNCQACSSLAGLPLRAAGKSNGKKVTCREKGFEGV